MRVFDGDAHGTTVRIKGLSKLMGGSASHGTRRWMVRDAGIPRP